MNTSPKLEAWTKRLTRDANKKGVSICAVSFDIEGKSLMVTLVSSNAIDIIEAAITTLNQTLVEFQKRRAEGLIGPGEFTMPPIDLAKRGAVE